MSILYEAVRRIEVNGYVIRLWIKDDARPAARGYFDSIANAVRHSFSGRSMASLKDVADYLMAAHGQLNAIEIVDQRGSGCVLYRDWP